MPHAPLTHEQILALLSAAPDQLAQLTNGLPAARLAASPAADAWSPLQILAHLRACCDVWGGYMQRILDEDAPRYRAMSPRTWVKRTDFAAQDFAASFVAFTRQRVNLVALLRSLDEADWARSATVTGFSRPKTLSVHSYGEMLANHEQVHLRQLERTLGVLGDMG